MNLTLKLEVKHEDVDNLFYQAINSMDKDGVHISEELEKYQEVFRCMINNNVCEIIIHYLPDDTIIVDYEQAPNPELSKELYLKIKSITEGNFLTV